MPLIFHAFTWSAKTEGLFALWALALLIGLALFKRRENMAEIIDEVVEPDCIDACLTVSVKKMPRYIGSFSGYGLRG